MTTLKNVLPAILIMSYLFSFTVNAQDDGRHVNLVYDSKEVLNKMLTVTPTFKTYFDEAYGYVVFPKVTKAGIGIGGGTGRGVVFQNQNLVGTSRIKQATFGWQFGAHQYSEIILFKNKESFELFTNGKLKFEAQASAVAFKKGAATDASYIKGLQVFTLTRGGLMYEASMGGQHFSYEPIIEKEEESSVTMYVNSEGKSVTSNLINSVEGDR